MYKPKSSQKMKQTAFTLMPFHFQILEKLLGIRGASYSDIVRRALEEYYYSVYPPYKQETAAGKLKERKIKEIEQAESQDPEEYAVSIGAVVFSGTDGKKYGFLKGIGSSYRIEPYPVEAIKAMQDEKHPDHDIVEYHISSMVNMPVQEVLNLNHLSDNQAGAYSRRLVYNLYPVIFPGFEHEHQTEQIESSDQPDPSGSV